MSQPKREDAPQAPTESGGVNPDDVSERKQAEQNSQPSDPRFRNPVEGVQDYASYKLDVNGKVVDWNADAERIKGYRPEEIIGKDFSRFFPKEAIEAGCPEQELKTAAAEGRFEGQGWRLRSDDSRFWASVVVTPMWGESGNLIGFSKTTQDLTEQKRVEATLQDSEIRNPSIRDAPATDKKSDMFAVVSNTVPSMRRPHDWATIGFALTVALIVFGGILGFVNARHLLDDRRWVAHTHEVIGELESLLSTLKDAESGQRGYLLAENEAYLKHYDDALTQVYGQVKHLQSLTADKPEQQARLADLDGKIHAQLAELAQAIALNRKGDRTAALKTFKSDVGKSSMDGLRRDIAALQGVEQTLLQKREGFATGSYNTTIASILFSTILGCVLVSGVFYLALEDVRRRRQSAEVLEELKEHLRTTLGCIGDGVVSTDNQANVTYLNPVAEKLTGWTQANAVGKSLSTVFNIVNETTRIPVNNPVNKALEGSAIVGLANHTVLISKDGRERPIDDCAAPIRNNRGEVVGCVLVFRDVTDRRRNDRELEIREQQFRLLAESIPQLAWMSNPDGHVFWYNRRWYDYTGTTFEQMEGWGWQTVHDPSVLPKVLEQWNRCIATGESFEMVFPLKHCEGAFRPFLTRAVPVTDTEGRVVRWFGSCTDIYEQQETQDQLRRLAADLSEADHRKDEFLATLAHELRNPLSAVGNGLQLMGLAGIDAASIEKTRLMMGRQLTQLVRLIDDLMDVSRIRIGKIELHIEPLPLATVLNSAIESCRQLIEKMGHQLTVTLPEQPIVINADLIRLAQAFMNVLNNAAKYTDRGGQIQISAECHEGEVMVSVRDNGIGIDADQLPRVFEMFSQVDHSLEKSHGGLGIGLTLVKRLVELHGGGIQARSEGPGKGSEFIIRLPMVQQALIRQTIVDEDKPNGPKLPLRILIVDDNRDSADSLSMILELMGNHTRTAYDGRQGLVVANEFRPDVILLDLGMPTLNGYEACRRIRAQPGGGNLVIIAQTGWGQNEDRKLTYEAGFDHHIVKPVNPTALMKLLAPLLESAKILPRSQNDNFQQSL